MAERGSFRPNYEHFWHLISAEITLFRPKFALSAEKCLSAEMTPKAERFRQVPKLSLSAERPKRGPFGRTIIYSNEGEVKEVPRIFFTLSGFINVIMVS